MKACITISRRLFCADMSISPHRLKALVNSSLQATIAKCRTSVHTDPSMGNRASVRRANRARPELLVTRPLTSPTDRIVRNALQHVDPQWELIWKLKGSPGTLREFIRKSVEESEAEESTVDYLNRRARERCLSQPFLPVSRSSTSRSRRAKHG